MALWKEFFLRPTAEQSLLEGVVMISQWGQMNEEQLPSVIQTEKNIEKIAQRVTDLMGSSNQKSSKEILSFISQVLFEEMGFQIQDARNGSRDNFLIEKVNIANTK